MGGHGVSAGQPEAASHLDHAQAIAAAVAADGGGRGGGADAGPAAGRPAGRRCSAAAKTHHIVLLDDSFSMSDRWADTSAFEQAKQVVGGWPTKPRGKTIRRPSRSCVFRRPAPAAAARSPTCSKKPLTVGFKRPADEDAWARLRPSQTAAGPAEALEAIDRLAHKRDFEDRVVYIVSDFRANEWDDPAGCARRSRGLQDAGTQLQLVNCVDAVHANLAITGLQAGVGHPRGRRAAVDGSLGRQLRHRAGPRRLGAAGRRRHHAAGRGDRAAFPPARW